MANAYQQRALLEQLFTSAIAVARAENCVPNHLPLPTHPQSRIILLAAGKAAAAMTVAAERRYLDDLKVPHDRLTGLCVTRHGYAKVTRLIDVIEAGHPVPDAAGVAATEQALTLARAATPEDHVVVLLSGGGSANWIAPAGQITLDEKQALTRALLRSGATISEINTVRKHLSRIKGGRLALEVPQNVALTTLAISDVPHDDPASIASGPTVADPSRLEDALEICRRHSIKMAPAIAKALHDQGNETPKGDNPLIARGVFKIIAKPALSLEAAMKIATNAGYEVIQLGDSLEGEAREVAQNHARRAIALAAQGKRAVLLSGGELTVTIRGDGRGGPNQEYALALALALDGHPAISAIAGDTDGTDGGDGFADDPAGALIDPETLSRASVAGLDAALFLERNDSSGFFNALGDLVKTGPTYTNVNDFRAIIVDNQTCSQH